MVNTDQFKTYDTEKVISIKPKLFNKEFIYISCIIYMSIANPSTRVKLG